MNNLIQEAIEFIVIAAGLLIGALFIVTHWK